MSGYGHAGKRPTRYAERSNELTPTRTETKQARYRRTHGRPSRAQAPHVLTLVLPDGTPVAEYGWRVQGRGFTGHFMRRLTPPGTL